MQATTFNFVMIGSEKQVIDTFSWRRLGEGGPLAERRGAHGVDRDAFETNPTCSFP